MGRLLAKPSIPGLPGVWLPSGPSMDLNFLTGYLDPRVTFTRAGTATYFDSAGVMQTAAANAPRFDYDPVTLAPKGLLLEESRTNYLLRSDAPDNAVWVKVAGTTVVSDGTLRGFPAWQIADTNSADFCQVRQDVFGLTSGSYCLQVRVKKQTAATNLASIRIEISNGGSTYYAGVHVNPNTGVVNAGTGGWTSRRTNYGVLDQGDHWLLWVSCTLTVGDSIARCAIFPAHFSLVGSGVNTLLGAQTFADFQFQNGLFPTSSIPTTTAAVTRPADTLDSVEPHFSSWFNRAQGTIAMELSSFGAGKTNGVLFIQRSSAGPRHQITYGGTGGLSAAVVNDSDVIDVPSRTASGSVTFGAITKIAYGYANNDFVFTRDNLAVVTDLSGSVPLTVNVARFGFANGTPLNGHLRRFRYWNTRQTNTQVRELTV